MTSFANNIWYRYTTFMNSGGDASVWNEQDQNGSWQRCKGLVRREDGLVFRDSIFCSPCVEADYPIVTRAKREGDFLEGQDRFGTRYSKHGRILPTNEELQARHEARLAPKP